MVSREDEQLDQAVEALMTDAEPPGRLNAGLAALLRIAGDLRDLPREDFRARLAEDLRGRPMPSSVLSAVDLPALLRQLPTLVIGDGTTEEEANGAVRELGWLNDRMLGVMRFSGQTPWERHPAGDELLHVIEGEVEITVLADSGPTMIRAGAGSVFVCPQGLWHRHYARDAVTILFGTPVRTSEVSTLEDPRAADRQELP